MITAVCNDINNYFAKNKYIGAFTIDSGVLNPPVDLVNGQYYRVVGSRFNDGVHVFGSAQDVLIDEPEFDGAIWEMCPPKSFLELVEEINDYCSTNSSQSPYLSESFDGYSYTRASKNGVAVTWKDAFATRLNSYRRLRP